MSSDKSKYYDWQKTLSYNARLTMVVTARGRGKTFGIRAQCIRDYIKGNTRFVEVCRHKNELQGLQADYFGKVSKIDEFKDYVFKSEGQRAYIALKVPEGRKPEWQLLGYFVALSEYQAIKKRTFVDVRRIIFDEAIIEKLDNFHRYLPDEYEILKNVVDSVTRENPADFGRASIYLLGNACDLVNPYFQVFGLNDIPKYGYTWFNSKRFLLHYEQPGEYAAEKKSKTLAGIMGEATGSNAISADNVFDFRGREFIAEKPKNAKFDFGMIYKGQKFGAWIDESEGFYYINSKIPENTDRIVYALTAKDNRPNMIVAQRAEKPLRNFMRLYCLGIVKFDTPATMEKFLSVLSIFGIR